MKQLDFDRDRQMDIILLDKNSKGFVLIDEFKNDKTFNQIEKFFFFPLSDLAEFKMKDSPGQTYVFASEKENICGLSAFTKYGTMLFLNKISFDSSPSFVDAADYDLDSVREALISGRNFDGISILEEDNFTLSETKITGNKAYSGAKFFDYNYDGYPDIIAFNIFDYSFDFYTNLHTESFEFDRSLEIKQNINQFEIFDVNKDNFKDLLFLSDNKFHVYFGDSVSSFSRRKEFNFVYSPKKFTIGDYNSDDRYDYAFIDASKGQMTILFNPLGNRPNSVLTYDNTDRLVDIATVDDTLLTVGKTGKFNVLTRLKELSDDVGIKFNSNISDLVTFETIGSNYPNIAALSKHNSLVHLLINANSEPFTYYHKVTVLPEFNRLTVNKAYTDSISIVLYSHNRRTFQHLGINLLNNSITKKDYYCKHAIIDLNTINNENKVEKITALTKADSALTLETFIPNKTGLEEHSIDTITSSFTEAMFLNSEEQKIFYLSEADSTIILNEIIPLYENAIQSFPLKVSAGKGNFGLRKAILKTGYDTRRIPLLFKGENEVNEIFPLIKGELRRFDYNNPVSKIKNENSKSLFFENPLSHSIEKIEFTGTRQFKTVKVIESNKGNRYLKWFISTEKIYLLHKNDQSSTINFRLFE